MRHLKTAVVLAAFAAFARLTVRTYAELGDQATYRITEDEKSTR